MIPTVNLLCISIHFIIHDVSLFRGKPLCVLDPIGLSIMGVGSLNQMNFLFSWSCFRKEIEYVWE